MESGKIIIKGARVNNLKNIDVEIHRDKFVVITGLSGSGKSSLAFDTLYAEGQRRFAESLSSYARQFLGRMSKPDVDMIDGIPPAVAIEQRVNVRNPRSTVATTTEIYDYIRLLFARIGHTFSPVTGKEVVLEDNATVVKHILSCNGDIAYILADIDWDEREDKVELMLSLKEQGYTRLFSASSAGVLRIEEVMQSGDNAPVGLMLMVDRLKLGAAVDDGLKSRLWASVQDAFDRGNGKMKVAVVTGNLVSFREFSCSFEADGMVFRKPDEYLFSFNSPIGACPVCGGLGRVDGISEDLVVPDKSKSIYDGALAPYRGDKMSWFKDLMCRNGYRYGLDVFKPYCRLSEEERSIVWKGVTAENEDDGIVGLNEFFKWVETQRYKIQYKYMLSRFSGRATCQECGGSRLRREALWVKIGGLNIRQVLALTVGEALEWFKALDLTEYDKTVAGSAIDEVLSRLNYLKDVGLHYLTLDRASNTLSGGESQRINLATALGSCLIGSLYILDEPSIGLHPRDTARLISVLERLRDMGNTVVVVEHDEEIMRAADEILDMGPGAGRQGGRVTFQGPLPTLSEMPNAENQQMPDAENSQTPEAANRLISDIANSLTVQYLIGNKRRFSRNKIKPEHFIRLEGAQEHNLKDIDVSFPLSCLTVVSGVSGSGKSTLVGDILFPALMRALDKTGPVPGTHRALTGDVGMLSHVEYVDQSPIGKSSRSNAVTYLKIYDDIRRLLSEQQYAKISGYTPSFFSFNQDGGRCPECQGEGYIKIPMQFMSDVTMVCEACGGRRFKPDILQVRYREKNVDDILALSVEEAVDFFGQDPNPLAVSIKTQLQYLMDVGLGYIKLGQSSNTLSGGESQRIKLAYFLLLGAKEKKRNILFIFDEPTTGLHFQDVDILLKCFDKLVLKGHSVVAVEHNPDVIRAADWVIDLGPDAGSDGGDVVYAGPPEDMDESSHTGKYIKKHSN